MALIAPENFLSRQELVDICSEETGKVIETILRLAITTKPKKTLVALIF